MEYKSLIHYFMFYIIKKCRMNYIGRHHLRKVEYIILKRIP